MIEKITGNMSENKTTENAVPQVTFQDAVEFLSKRAPNACPACGHNSWSVSAPRKAGERTVANGLAIVDASNGNIYMQGTPLVTATCKKCGYMRNHGLHVISQWVADGKPEFAE